MTVSAIMFLTNYEIKKNTFWAESSRMEGGRVIRIVTTHTTFLKCCYGAIHHNVIL